VLHAGRRRVAVGGNLGRKKCSTKGRTPCCRDIVTNR
jgi:hypothetical protein